MNDSRDGTVDELYDFHNVSVQGDGVIQAHFRLRRCKVRPVDQVLLVKTGFQRRLWEGRISLTRGAIHVY